MRILTFDVEDWFHILNYSPTSMEGTWSSFESRVHGNMARILQLLTDTGQQATFFVLGWIARQFPDIVKQIDQLGFEIGSHSSAHRLTYELTPGAFEQDLTDSIGLLEDIVGKKVTTYRCPGFSVTADTEWYFESVLRCGIEIDCSIFPACRGHGGFPSFGAGCPCLVEATGGVLKEFPVSVYRALGRSVVFSGGGYFRLMPYFLTRALVGSSSYVMTYFHPRDFDPGQPVLGGLPLHRRFKSYYGLRSSFSKLQRLLRDFEFMDVRTADRHLQWEDQPVIMHSRRRREGP